MIQFLGEAVFYSRYSSVLCQLQIGGAEYPCCEDVSNSLFNSQTSCSEETNFIKATSYEGAFVVVAVLAYERTISAIK